jgi:hypothetical protein
MGRAAGTVGDASRWKEEHMRTYVEEGRKGVDAERGQQRDDERPDGRLEQRRDDLSGALALEHGWDFYEGLNGQADGRDEEVERQHSVNPV